EDRVRDEIHQQLQSFVGPKSASMLSSMMTAQKRGDSLMATVIGGVALVLGATGVFGQLQDSLNVIWGVTTKPGSSLGAFMRDRFFSMAMVLGTGFLLLVSMALTATVHAFASHMSNIIAVPPWTAVILDTGISLVVVTLLFAMIFKVLPDV